MDTISILGAISAILLVIEVLVVVILVGGVIYFLRRGIIAGRREASPYVQQATEQVYRVEELTKKYANLIVGAQVEALSTLRGLRRGLRILVRENDAGGKMR